MADVKREYRIDGFFAIVFYVLGLISVIAFQFSGNLIHLVVFAFCIPFGQVYLFDADHLRKYHMGKRK